MGKQNSNRVKHNFQFFGIMTRPWRHPEHSADLELSFEYILTEHNPAYNGYVVPSVFIWEKVHSVFFSVWLYIDDLLSHAVTLRSYGNRKLLHVVSRF